MEDIPTQITVHEITVSKAALLKAPELERLFFILLGHFGNELVILSKMTIATIGVKTSTPLEERAQNVQAVFLTRLMLAKMFEGWEKLFQKIFLGRGLFQIYRPHLSKKDMKALDALKKYFANAKHLAAIRNDFTFHYPDKKLIAAIPAIPDTEDWKLYVSRTYGNSLYYASDMIASYALLAEIDRDQRKAFDKMIKDRNFLGRELMNLNHACMNVFVHRHLDVKLSPETEIRIAVRRLADLRLPYFAER